MRRAGFTLTELLIAMTVIAIIAGIAIPNYSRYLTRGQLTEATNVLSDFRVRMEQFYQDNRSYIDAGGACGAALPTGLTNFTVACAPANAGQTYRATATGINTMVGFGYSIDQNNARATTALPSSWGALPADAGTRWVLK